MRTARTLLAAAAITAALAAVGCTDDSEWARGSSTTTSNAAAAEPDTPDAGNGDVPEVCAAIEAFQQASANAYLAVVDASDDEKLAAEQAFISDPATVALLDNVIDTAPDELRDDARLIVDATLAGPTGGGTAPDEAALAASERFGAWANANCPAPELAGPAGPGGPTGPDGPVDQLPEELTNPGAGPVPIPEELTGN